MEYVFYPFSCMVFLMIMKKPTAGIILAAGMSTRMGTPKQLLKFKGAYLINRVLDASLGSLLDTVVLVLGFSHEKILEAIGKRREDPRLDVVINRDFKKGLSGSLHCGFQKTASDYPSVMFLLGDMPLLDSETINHLLNRFWSSEKEICVPLCNGEPKNPTLFSRNFYKELLNTTGDMGARKIIKANPSNVLFLDIHKPSHFMDVDTTDDVKAVLSILEATDPSL